MRREIQNPGELKYSSPVRDGCRDAEIIRRLAHFFHQLGTIGVAPQGIRVASTTLGLPTDAGERDGRASRKALDTAPSGRGTAGASPSCLDIEFRHATAHRTLLLLPKRKIFDRLCPELGLAAIGLHHGHARRIKADGADIVGQQRETLLAQRGVSG